MTRAILVTLWGVLAMGAVACDGRDNAGASGDASTHTRNAALDPGRPAGAEEPFAVVLAGEPIRVERRASGLVVEVFGEGTGRAIARGEVALVSFERRLTDGTILDSSARRRAVLRVPLAEGRAVKGLIEGLEGVRVGERRRLRVPYRLAYGEIGRPPVPARANLVFDLELVGIGEGD